MRLIKCDRCGKELTLGKKGFVVNEHPQWTKVLIDGSDYTNQFDLCQACCCTIINDIKNGAQKHER